jgi:lysophospholipid hydrolase
MGELNTRLIWVHSTKQQQEVADQCDLFLSPPVHEYGTLDYHLFDEIYNLGYEYSKPKIEAFIKQKEYEWIVPTL